MGNNIHPAEVDLLRKRVLAGDRAAVRAMRLWQIWQDTPREQQSTKRHARRAWERAASAALTEVPR